MRSSIRRWHLMIASAGFVQTNGVGFFFQAHVRVEMVAAVDASRAEDGHGRSHIEPPVGVRTFIVSAASRSWEDSFSQHGVEPAHQILDHLRPIELVLDFVPRACVEVRRHTRAGSGVALDQRLQPRPVGVHRIFGASEDSVPGHEGGRADLDLADGKLATVAADDAKL